MADRTRAGTARRYGRYDGGPDPLAPPVDLAEALDAIGEDVMAGLLARSARCGSSCAAAAATSAASTTWPAGSPSGAASCCSGTTSTAPSQEVRELLDHAVLEERKQLARDVDLDDGDRALREMQLENLPPSTAAAVSELSSYDWQSREAREDYEKIKDLLGRELLDQRFAGMKQALENATDEDRAAINEMLGDLNELLEKHRRGEDTAGGLRRVHGQARRLLPGEPAEHRRAARRARPARRGRAADAATR